MLNFNEKELLKGDNKFELTERLKDYFNCFAQQETIGTSIESILPIFYILIDLGDKNNDKIGLIATCCAAEIVRNFKNDYKLNLESVDPKYIYILYKNYSKHISGIKYKENNYVWKYHLLRILSDIQLLNLKLFPMITIKSKLIENLFIELMRTLYDIGATWDNREHFQFQLINNFQQLLKSATYINPAIVIKELFAPIYNNRCNSIKYFVKKNIKQMMMIHYNYLINLFYSKMEISKYIIFEIYKDFEMFNMIVDELDLVVLPNNFISIIFEKLKNNYFIYHENTVELLAIYLYKYSKENYNHIIDIKENMNKFQILFYKFYNSMVRPDFRCYNKILIKYGNRLIINAPSEKYKIGYLKIFFHYIKVMKVKNFDYIKLIEIFQGNIKTL